MKIYTRTGDRGETGLFGGRRVPKDDVRVEAYGAVDELNAVLGLAAARLASLGPAELVARLHAIQTELFTIGANLATPSVEDGGRPSSYIPGFAAERIAELEAWIDEAETELEPLRNFVLPGGSEAAALLHLARTVCRRAERRVVSLARQATIAPELVIYLNRLSDLCFTWARLANRRAGVSDVAWRAAGGERKAGA